MKSYHTDLILITPNSQYKGSPLEYITTYKTHPHLDSRFATQSNYTLEHYCDEIHNDIEKLIEANFKYIIVSNPLFPRLINVQSA
jgi:hypothetical protein